MPRKSSRKSNSKRRKKPKYLSLRLQLSPEKTQTTNSAASATRRRNQLNLNLHPQNPHEDESVAADFFSATLDGGSATLAALLGGGYAVETQDSETMSPSLTYAREAQDSEESEQLVRTAMRRKTERDTCEEKWVCYEEVTSCAADQSVKVHPQGLSLKLDYQEIINAWCDKGPLYMEGPQTVPDLYNDFLSGAASNGSNEGWTSNGSLWTVPENTLGLKGEQELEEELKIRHREASVLRYKEKRQNRLFSKRIRYEVRKINAEKRPRMKGRFVKRS